MAHEVLGSDYSHLFLGNAEGHHGYLSAVIPFAAIALKKAALTSPFRVFMMTPPSGSLSYPCDRTVNNKRSHRDVLFADYLAEKLLFVVRLYDGVRSLRKHIVTADQVKL